MCHNYNHWPNVNVICPLGKSKYTSLVNKNRRKNVLFLSFSHNDIFLGWIKEIKIFFVWVGQQIGFLNDKLLSIDHSTGCESKRHIQKLP